MSHRLKRKALDALISCIPGLDKAFEARYTSNYHSAVAGGEFVLRPSNIDGVFLADARSHIARRIVMTGSYEPDVTHALGSLHLKPGAIVNVGANVGLLAIYLAGRFPDRHIIAIEPNPASLVLLEKNVAQNGVSNRVSIVPYCVSAQAGDVEFSVIDGLSEYSSIASIVHPATAEKQRRIMKVPAKTLSEITGDNRIALIFSDAEGAEELVFSGARDVLTRDRPALFFECSELLLSKFGSSSKKLEALLNSLGYTVSDALKTGLRLKHPFEGEAIAISNIPEKLVPLPRPQSAMQIASMPE